MMELIIRGIWTAALQKAKCAGGRTGGREIGVKWHVPKWNEHTHLWPYGHVRRGMWKMDCPSLPSLHLLFTFWTLNYVLCFLFGSFNLWMPCSLIKFHLLGKQWGWMAPTGFPICWRPTFLLDQTLVVQRRGFSLRKWMNTKLPTIQ
jgi:hypothetical protein